MAVQEEKEHEEILEVIQEKPKMTHVIEEFLFLNAIDKKSAIKLEKLELELELYQDKINNLIELEILVQTTKTKYYLDVEAYKIYKEKTNKMFFLRLVSIVIPGLLFLLLGVAWIIM